MLSPTSMLHSQYFKRIIVFLLKNVQSFFCLFVLFVCFLKTGSYLVAQAASNLHQYFCLSLLCSRITGVQHCTGSTLTSLSHYSPDWPLTSQPPASVSCLLALQHMAPHLAQSFKFISLYQTRDGRQPYRSHLNKVFLVNSFLFLSTKHSVLSITTWQNCAS